MQLALFIDGRHGTLPEVDDRLRRRFGGPGPWLRLDPVSQLVAGMIGGKTRGAVSQHAFEALLGRFEAWEDVRDAQVGEIHAPIRQVTFADVKAVRLKAALQAITEARGRLELDFLQTMPVEVALAWLERLPGVGRKTSAVALNFSSLRRKALVIDTHHLRVLKRLGLVGPRAGTTEAYERVMACLPSDWQADDLTGHHHLVKTLGQTVCRHAVQDCQRCPLHDMCPSSLFAAPRHGVGGRGRHPRAQLSGGRDRSPEIARFQSVGRRSLQAKRRGGS